MCERSRTAEAGRRPLRRAALLAAAAAALVLPAAAPAPSGAQSDDFVNGEAEASADTFTLNIIQGNANIGFTYGRSIAGYRDRTASAEGRALDLGVLPTLFAVEQCDGSTPPMNPATLPPVTRVDSTEANAGRSRRVEVFVPGTDGGPHGPRAGFQDAMASPLPASRALTESVDTDVVLLALDGGRTEVTSRLEGRVRQAHAVVTADELRVFGGLFTFTEPRWEALARSGDVEEARGSFTFESATVLGVPRSHEEALRDFGEFERGLEQLLRPFGVQLDLPTVEVEDGKVEVTPMAFRVVDPPFGKQVLAPFFGSIQPYREAAARQAVAEDCKVALSITLLDVVLGVLAGSGSVEVLAGGAQAFTADTDFSAPPLEPLPVLDALPPPPMPAPPELPPPPPPVAPVEVAPATTTPPDDGAEVAAATATRPVRAAVPTSRFEDGEAGAAAVAVGLGGLVGALALAGGDRLLGRRRARRSAA